MQAVPGLGSLSTDNFMVRKRSGNKHDMIAMGAVVDATPDGLPGKDYWMSNLGIVLDIRFQRLGNISDIQEAIGMSGVTA